MAENWREDKNPPADILILIYDDEAEISAEEDLLRHDGVLKKCKIK